MSHTLNSLIQKINKMASTDMELDKERETARSLIEELYTFNQQYYLNNNIENPTVKESAVKTMMEETIKQLKHYEDSLPHPFYQYLYGKALNVLTTYSKEAEQSLSHAVKQDPLIVDAWNCLGESYWKQGNVQQAYHCFLGGLSHEKNKVSLRNLSMVLRQMGTSVEEKQSKLTESLDKAKEAVSLDVKDGVSWMVLGNAYLAVFFKSNQDNRLLQQCANAYVQAEKDQTVSCNPDLHFNKATLLLYQEEYRLALVHLEQACRFDPGWPIPRQKLSSLKDFLQTFSQSISTKGKLKPKRLATLQSSLSTRDQWVTDKMAANDDITIRNLREGIHGNEKRIIGGVAACVTNDDRVPFGCVLVDSNGDSIGVTLYNVSSSCHFNIGDVFTITGPSLTHMDIKDLGVDYDSIQITEPRKMLLCNGRPLSHDKLSSSVAQVTAFS